MTAAAAFALVSCHAEIGSLLLCGGLLDGMLTLQPIEERVRGEDTHVGEVFRQDGVAQRILMQPTAHDRDARHVLQFRNLRGGVRLGGGLLGLDHFR